MKAVIFDLDGVITDTAKFHFQAWQELARSVNIALDLDFEEKLKGISRMDSLNLILNYGGKEQSFSQQEKEQMATRKNDAYICSLEQLTAADVLPGISELLQSLREAGIKTAIASASKNAPFILEKLKLTAMFDAIADPDSVAKGKPAPDIFLEAARLVDVAPKDCIGIEDAVAGLEGIKAAGMKSVGIGIENNNRDSEITVFINETAELTMPLLLTM